MPKTYRTSTGDTWDLIAFKMYGTEKGDENHISELINANYTLKDISVFSADVILTIPDLHAPVTAANNLPPWKVA